MQVAELDLCHLHTNEIMAHNEIMTRDEIMAWDEITARNC